MNFVVGRNDRGAGARQSPWCGRTPEWRCRARRRGCVSAGSRSRRSRRFRGRPCAVAGRAGRARHRRSESRPSARPARGPRAEGRAGLADKVDFPAAGGPAMATMKRVALPARLKMVAAMLGDFRHGNLPIGDCRYVFRPSCAAGEANFKCLRPHSAQTVASWPIRRKSLSKGTFRDAPSSAEIRICPSRS